MSEYHHRPFRSASSSSDGEVSEYRGGFDRDDDDDVSQDIAESRSDGEISEYRAQRGESGDCGREDSESGSGRECRGLDHVMRGLQEDGDNDDDDGDGRFKYEFNGSNRASASSFDVLYDATEPTIPSEDPCSGHAALHSQSPTRT